MEQHEVQLVAYDNGSPSLSSSFSINILVQVNLVYPMYNNLAKTN